MTATPSPVTRRPPDEPLAYRVGDAAVVVARGHLDSAAYTHVDRRVADALDSGGLTTHASMRAAMSDRGSR